MPQKRQQQGDGQFTLSYKTLGAVVTLLTLVGILYGGLSRVATKDDVEKLNSTYTNTYSAIETRVRNLEIQFASFFGKNASLASPIKPSSDEEQQFKPAFLRRVSAQEYPNTSSSMAQQSIPRGQYRRVVVTFAFIKGHDLTPSRGGSYAVYGEDGQFYALDDVLAVLIQEHQETMHPQPQMKMRK